MAISLRLFAFSHQRLPTGFRHFVFVPLLFLLAACNTTPFVPTPIEDIDLPAPGTFIVNLSGDINSEFSGTARLAVSLVGQSLYLTGEYYSANLVFPANQTTGTFEIRPYQSAANDVPEFIAVGGVVVDSTRSETKDVTMTAGNVSPVTLPYGYTNVREGRLTLLSVNPASGAFEFTVADDSGAAVQVRATFAEVVPENWTP